MFMVSLHCGDVDAQRIRVLLRRNTRGFQDAVVAVLERGGRILVIVDAGAKGVFVLGKVLRYADEHNCLAIVYEAEPITRDELGRRVAGILASKGALKLYKHFEQGRYPPRRLLSRVSA